MKVINDIFILLTFFVFIATNEDVVNTCGVIGYNQPTDSSQCKQDGEICCFIEIKNEKNTTDAKTNKKFCVTSPSLIDIKDVKEEIEKDTGFKLAQLVCNNSNFIKNTLFIFLLFFLF